ncbi:hypothetical protein DMI70_07975 [Escherichia coli]|nr:hypothetical protein [Escherichia coli]
MSDATLRVLSCLQICAFFASRFPDLTQHHCRLFLFFLPLRKGVVMSEYRRYYIKGNRFSR